MFVVALCGMAVDVVGWWWKVVVFRDVIVAWCMVVVFADGVVVGQMG